MSSSTVWRLTASSRMPSPPLTRADDELGHQPGERLVVGREGGGGGADAAAQVLGRAAGHRRGEQLVEVGVREPALALLREREAVGQEGALGLLAAVQRALGAVAGDEAALLGARVLVDGRGEVQWPGLVGL